MNRWLRLIGYGLTTGSFIKLSIAMAPSGVVPGVPLGAISFPLFAWSSLAICPLVVFANRNRELRESKAFTDTPVWYRVAVLTLTIGLAVVPTLLGYRHLWWLGLLCPWAVIEAALSPQKPFDSVDLFDYVINRLAGKPPQA